MVDGTKVRLRGSKGTDVGKVDMRWALASVEEDKPFEPLVEKLAAILAFHFTKGGLEN
ncbi:hypothetical protein H5U35_03980 [Candidatus Aerophobetes bacterium]|nr:hypothetical protein [Candidatus Aerophobetes bacterium]